MVGSLLMLVAILYLATGMRQRDRARSASTCCELYDLPLEP